MSKNTNLNDRTQKKRQFLTYLKILKPIILSHHPNCGRFNNHVLKIGNVRFCIGCFIGYPTAFISILLLGYIKSLTMLKTDLFLLIGIILLSSFILSLLNLIKTKLIKVIQKALIGIGAAFLFWWIWSLPNSFPTNFLIYFITFSTIISIFNIYHAYGFYRICKKCEYSLKWNRCPGFRKYFEEIEKFNTSSKEKIPYIK